MALRMELIKALIWQVRRGGTSIMRMSQLFVSFCDAIMSFLKRNENGLRRVLIICDLKEEFQMRSEIVYMRLRTMKI